MTSPIRRRIAARAASALRARIASRTAAWSVRLAVRPLMRLVKADRGSQRGLDDFLELDIERILRGSEHRHVEGDIGMQWVVVTGLRRRHSLPARIDCGEIGDASRARRECRGFGLDRDAQLVEVAQQLDRKIAFEQPAEHIGIEQVPRCRRLDHRALPRPRAEQAFGGQHLDRLASHRPADAVLPRQFGLGRKRRRLVLAGDDRFADAVEQTIG